jgi:type I restriction enzyme S subunit
LNVRDIKNLPTPFPPLPEQHEIVRRVEKLFAFADRMETRYTAARSQVEKLTPSLIAKAFRGEQVEQDPTDEPAAVLLERIRAQKESAHTRKRTASVLPDFPRRDNPPVGAASGREQSVIRGQRPLLQKSSESVAPITPRQHPPRAPQGHETGTGVFPCRTDRRHRLSDADWTWAIRQLRESGQVVQVGERRGARYHRKE